MGFKGQKVRTQLLAVFGGLVAVSFLIVLTICVASVTILRNAVLRECDKALRLQIRNNSNFILAETADVLEAKMQTGLKSLALPAALAIHGASQPQYSVTPPATSYADSSKDTLKPPLTTDFRYPCLASESAALQTRRGCDDGYKSISETSAVYVAPGTRFDGSNLASLMAAKQSSVQLSAVVDSFVKNSWSKGGGWTGAYVVL